MRGVLRLSNTVLDTRADGITVTNAVAYGAADGTASSNITIQGNLIERAGDDSISIVSYLNDAGMRNNGITVAGNTVADTHNDRGVAIAGGSNISVVGNNIQVGSSGNAGIELLADGGFGTYGDSQITVANNTIKNAGYAGGIFVWNGNAPSAAADRLNSNLAITGNSIYNSAGDGITLVGGAANTSVTITGNVAYNPGTNLVVNNVDGAQIITNSNNLVLPDSVYPGDLAAAGTGSGMPLPQVAQHTITLIANGVPFQGNSPVLRVTVDGQQVKSDTAVSAVQSSGNWETITIQPFLVGNPGKIGLELVNDPGIRPPATAQPSLASQIT
jgi:hypothetical protein